MNIPQRSYSQAIIKVLRPRGRSATVYDRPRMALLPGKRISRTGKVYWETRKNRSDMAGSRV